MDICPKNQCMYCERTFKSNWGLTQHVDKIHLADKENKKGNQSKSANTKSAVKGIGKLVSTNESKATSKLPKGSRQLKFGQCWKIKEEKEEDSVQAKSKHVEDSSDKEVKSKSKKSHKSRTGDPNKCPACGKTFCERRRLQTHINSVHLRMKVRQDTATEFASVITGQCLSHRLGSLRGFTNFTNHTLQYY